jgi:hypothetical protein
MAALPQPLFHHRHNLDGTFESVCLGCFTTFSIRADETALETAEREHECPAKEIPAYWVRGKLTKDDPYQD